MPALAISAGISNACNAIFDLLCTPRACAPRQERKGVAAAVAAGFAGAERFFLNERRSRGGENGERKEEWKAVASRKGGKPT